MRAGLFLLAMALLGAVLYFVVREVWNGVGEAKREFDARKRTKSGPKHAAGSGPEDAEPPGRPRGPNQAPKAWHEVLGVVPTASLLEIKAAYHQRISRYHPDRVAGLGEDLRELAEQRAKEINEAYALARVIRS